ncbi:hypothetical protein LEP1GSC195_2746 [Leptospira wolbachii serovar Codice str. CDC]|uniref:Uncharacterized protein n=1 Tax=Leptospira wolbachii serovar Codice str. CDC TaxID=1218599 RepID=R9A5I3_9LEPT|nr:hypothetical protein LEP1GSC195_2746 [Leptospira wolbachii serovar Codice str. CDC]
MLPFRYPVRKTNLHRDAKFSPYWGVRGRVQHSEAKGMCSGLFF